MKSIVSLCVVLALAALASSAVVKAPNSRSNLTIGSIFPGDRLLYRQYFYKPAIVNAIQYQDVIYRGNRTTRISAIRASEVGYTQFGQVWVLNGGVGYQNVTLRIQSARGYGYYYVIDIWGR